MDRTGRRLAGTIAIIAAGLAVPHLAGAAESDPVANGGSVIVRYAPGTAAGQKADARQDADVAFSDSLLLPGTQVVNPDPGQSVRGAVNDLEADPDVLYAEPNYIERIQADPPLQGPPNDPFLGNQWGLYNFGQSLLVGSTHYPGTAGDDIDARAGWYIQKTSPDVITAVIDSGIDTNNPDLANQLWTNPGEIAGNGLDDDHNGFVDDVHGWNFVGGNNNVEDGLDHGTHVAGTIGATGNNGIAGTGVSWDATIMPLKVCPAAGGCSISAMVDAIAYASHMGATVANISIAGHSYSEAQRDALSEASNVLFSVAAGNNANDGVDSHDGDNEHTPTYPCQADQLPANRPRLGNLICVGASDQNDGWANFSNFGPTSVDLAAPGMRVLSTIPQWQYPKTDDFEGAAGWNYVNYPTVSSTGWERQPGIGFDSSHAITDSPVGTNYATNTDSKVETTTGVDLAGKNACRVTYYFKSNTEEGDVLAHSDVFYLEASHDSNPAGSWTRLDTWVGDHDDSWNDSALDGNGDLADFEGDPSVYFRFGLKADGDPNVEDGAVVDNFTVRCAGTTGNTVGYLNGTSMAAPHVAGLASLVREAAPGLSTPEVKAAILGGVDPDPAFATAGPHPTVTGGRENIYNTLHGLDLTPPPVPELQSPADNARIQGNQRFSWSVPDITADYQLVIDNGEPVAEGTALSHGEFNIPPGHHTWFVRAVDGSGNVSKSKTRSFTYFRNPKISIRSVKVRHGRRGGAVVQVKVPAPGKVKVIGQKTRKSGRDIFVSILARGASSTPSGGSVIVVLHLTKKGKVALRRKGSIRAEIDVIYRAKRDRGHPGIAHKSGRIGAPGR